MEFKPTVFEVEINGQLYKFAALTMRQMENAIEKEKAADGDKDVIKKLNYELLAHAMRRADAEVTASELAENMDVLVFRSLLSAFLTAQGVKLEAKSTGEVSLS